MTKVIRKIEQKQIPNAAKKRVAAYARVSVPTERLLHSLDEQISYYSNLIQKTPGWEYAGVFADRGISGTQSATRDQFQKMLAECEAGHIDIILTKSLSRFARNTVDTLQTVRRLRAHFLRHGILRRLRQPIRLQGLACQRQVPQNHLAVQPQVRRHDLPFAASD